ncbi:hypothetical protein V8F20_010133 [Naviculisporaceae sp. PSN 640]
MDPAQERSSAPNDNAATPPGSSNPWEEPYDPTRPTNIDEWFRSDEPARVEKEWKDFLMAERLRRLQGMKEKHAVKEAKDASMTSSGNPREAVGEAVGEIDKKTA